MTEHDYSTKDLSAFLKAVFEDAVAAGADAITITSGPEAIQVTHLKQKSELKSAKGEILLLKPLLHWLYERYSIFQHRAPRPPENDSSWSFTVSARLGEHLFWFTTAKTLRLNGTTHISITQINRMSIDAALERFGLHNKEQEVFTRGLSASSGIFTLSSPNQDLLDTSLSALRSLADAATFTIARDPVEAASLAHSGLVVFAVRTDDPVDPVVRLRSAGFPFSKTPFLGSLCHGFIRRVCASCAREGAINQDSITVLPELLRGKLQGKYQIGRGCDRCGHSGYDGLVGIRSFVQPWPDFVHALETGMDHSSLVGIAYRLGAVSLFEDGLQKVNEGVTTLEALYQCTRVLPEVYSRCIRDAVAQVSSRPLDLPDDFFTAENAEKPVSGAEVFAGESPAEKAFIKKSRATPVILLVEDDPDQRHLLELLFKSSGYEVSLACDGAEGFEKVSSLFPDLVVSDLMMPRMDGAELVRKIRATNSISRTPVLMLTVVSDVQKEYELLDLGADDYCEKTIQRKILLKRVENLLKRV